MHCETSTDISQCIIYLTFTSFFSNSCLRRSLQRRSTRTNRQSDRNIGHFFFSLRNRQGSGSRRSILRSSGNLREIRRKAVSLRVSRICCEELVSFPDGSLTSSRTRLAIKNKLSELSVQTGLIFSCNCFSGLPFRLSLEIILLRNSHSSQNTEQHKYHNDFNQRETAHVVFHTFTPIKTTLNKKTNSIRIKECYFCKR